MAQQTDPQSLTDPSLETINAPPSLANPADDSALTTDSATTYNSLPLTHSKSTRVLRILPSKLNQADTIHVELQTISLDDDPRSEFCALSYVWGSPSETKRIMVNNEPFLVRANLWNFLDLMRRREFSDLLWIDAICINQDCIPERNHQVSVMGDIYRGATRIIAWLGPESELVLPDEEMPDESEIENSTIERYCQAPLFDSIRLIFDNLSVLPKDDYHYQAEVTELIRLLAQKAKELNYAEYWSRIWVVQEYTLARDVTLLTDRSQMNGKDFLHIYKDYVNSYDFGMRCSMADMTPMIRFKPSRHMDCNLRRLIHRYRDSKCMDPRDHVYALLSLVDPEDLEYLAINPDYSKSELLLFVELTYKMMRRRGLDERKRRTWIENQRGLAEALGIEESLAVELERRMVSKVRLDIKLDRQRWDLKISEELAQLVFAVERWHRMKEPASDVDTSPC